MYWTVRQVERCINPTISGQENGIVGNVRIRPNVCEGSIGYHISILDLSTQVYWISPPAL